MHAFHTLVKDVIQHPWARAIIASLQRVVIFVRTCHKVQALMANIRTDRPLLKPALASKTRISSVYNMLATVIPYIRHLRFLLDDEEDGKSRVISSSPSGKGVAKIIRDSKIWEDAAILRDFLKPFHICTTAMQQDNANIGDVTRCILFLGREISPYITGRNPLITEKGKPACA
jgi:hypothetical protein